MMRSIAVVRTRSPRPIDFGRKMEAGKYAPYIFLPPFSCPYNGRLLVARRERRGQALLALAKSIAERLFDPID